MKSQGVYVECEETMAGLTGIFFGFEGGEYTVLNTQTEAIQFADFLMKISRKIKRDAAELPKKLK